MDISNLIKKPILNRPTKGSGPSKRKFGPILGDEKPGSKSPLVNPSLETLEALEKGHQANHESPAELESDTTTGQNELGRSESAPNSEDDFIFYPDPTPKDGESSIAAETSDAGKSSSTATTAPGATPTTEPEKYYQYILIPINPEFICKMTYEEVKPSKLFYCHEHRCLHERNPVLISDIISDELGDRHLMSLSSSSEESESGLIWETAEESDFKSLSPPMLEVQDDSSDDGSGTGIFEEFLDQSSKSENEEKVSVSDGSLEVDANDGKLEKDDGTKLLAGSETQVEVLKDKETNEIVPQLDEKSGTPGPSSTVGKKQLKRKAKEISDSENEDLIPKKKRGKSKKSGEKGLKRKAKDDSEDSENMENIPKKKTRKFGKQESKKRPAPKQGLVDKSNLDSSSSSGRDEIFTYVGHPPNGSRDKEETGTGTRKRDLASSSDDDEPQPSKKVLKDLNIAHGRWRQL